MRPGEALRIHLKGRRLVPGSPPLAEGGNILIPREQKLEEPYAAVLAGLLHAQQDKVFQQPLLAHLAVVEFTKASESLDRVLRRVVVPGCSVVVQEREESALVLE